MPTVIEEPSNPINAPSTKKGHLINVFVAPTSFIMPISRRRANIVTRIVLEIRNIATSPKPPTNAKPTLRTALVTLNNFSVVPLP
ncbi:hypothetical protein D3C73_1312360 [compost metagenome]